MEDEIKTENVELCVIKTDTKKLEYRDEEYIN